MNAFAAEINRVVEDVRRHYLVPGLAIAVVRNGDAIHVEAYGLRNTAGFAAADIHTAFAIGSCSKAFTCALAAALVDEGRLGWDDQVRTYLPDFQLHDPWISDHLTIRDLLANRTGLSRAGVAAYCARTFRWIYLCVSSTDSGTAPPFERTKPVGPGMVMRIVAAGIPMMRLPVRQADGDAGKDDLDRRSRAHAHTFLAIAAMITCLCATDVAYRFVFQFEFDCSRATVGT